MNRKVVRKLKKEVKLSLIIMLLILSIITYKSCSNKKPTIIDKVDYITNNSESDKDIVKEVFGV